MTSGWPAYIKTAFAEEPSIRQHKGHLGSYTNELKGQLGDNFSNCVDFREAKSELLEGYKTPFDFTELGKLAIDYSDGVIEGEANVSEVLLQYAAEKEKPVMKFPGV